MKRDWNQPGPAGDTGTPGYMPKVLNVAASISRAERRARGFRGRLYVQTMAAPFLPRYARRHAHKVVAVDFTSRSRFPKRREHRILAKMQRLLKARGLA